MHLVGYLYEDFQRTPLQAVTVHDSKPLLSAAGVGN
jgi:hypothetical protein